MARHTPRVFNTNCWDVAATATFWASGQDLGSAVLGPRRISWGLSNAAEGMHYTLTPSPDGKSCNVRAQEMVPGWVDLTCWYTNPDGTVADETLTICFHAESVDRITLVCTD